MKKHGQDAQTIGERHREAGMRVAAFLKEREGQHATKKLARATGACTRTVTEWLGGTFPASKHLHGLIDHYGAIFIEKAFGYVPGTGIHEARDNLRRALEALERDGT